MNSTIHIPCPGAKPPTEVEIERVFLSEGLSPHSWSNGPDYQYPAHSHSHYKLLYCVHGSISFQVDGTGEKIDLAPGDRMEIPPSTLHSATVGHSGVTCIEAFRRMGETW